jgi:hypothetical protein
MRLPGLTAPVAVLATALDCKGDGLTDPSRPELAISSPDGRDNQTGAVGTTHWTRTA